MLASWARVGRSALNPDVLRRTWRAVLNRLHSSWDAVGLRRDLATPLEAPAAAIGIRVRPLEQKDIPLILEVTDPQLSEEEKWERVKRRHMLDAGFGTCFVAATDDDKPCYMQWLITSRDNDKLHNYFSGLFPKLAPNEALLEGAFTPEAYRGKRIMQAAMAQIAEKGEGVGARYVITFVGFDNIASLKGCARAGFFPYISRSQVWRFFRCRTVFGPYVEPAAAAPVERPKTEAVKVAVN
ncbi:MAG TPA: GNAT family N-acetyltransferase [Dongiaceae bacterium]|jgi:hypothetical protein